MKKLIITTITAKDVTLQFEGTTADRTLTLPDDDGILAIGNQRLDTNSEVEFDAIFVNNITFSSVGTGADTPITDGDYTMAVGTVLRLRHGIISAINP